MCAETESEREANDMNAVILIAHQQIAHEPYARTRSRFLADIIVVVIVIR